MAMKKKDFTSRWMARSAQYISLTQGEYCLMDWDGLRVAVDIHFVKSVLLIDELGESSGRSLYRNVPCLTFDRNFTITHANAQTRKRIVFLTDKSFSLGVFCKNVVFTDARSIKEEAELPWLMKTPKSPIIKVLFIEPHYYFVIDFYKLLNFIPPCYEITTPQCERLQSENLSQIDSASRSLNQIFGKI
ncbi:hypothetical protein [Aliikangiella maris]|uniref:Uncharacterized protein n=2 Tax=Aliikangiella maris TaxID=3162458 RepID=A0ABV3MNE5_9GAMM